VTLTVLGPQRRPTLDSVTRAYGPQVRFATVTAGWQEREDDDAELSALLGGRAVNLALHARWLDVLDRDPELATAELNHRAVLDELQELYSIRLEHALNAVDAIRRSSARPRTRTAALADAERAVRLVDAQHLERVTAAQSDFEAAWSPGERPAIAAHRAAVADRARAAQVLVVAGGHVGVLLRVLTRFDLAAVLPDLVVAWSAGAMALTERVVLFGSGPEEVYDRGLGLIRDAVLFPHARRRLPIDDRVAMGLLSRRFAPAHCAVLDDRVRVDLDAGGRLPAGTRVVDSAGRVTARAP
jgi:hypothetical protein